jgi:hypothetical protein
MIAVAEKIDFEVETKIEAIVDVQHVIQEASDASNDNLTEEPAGIPVPTPLMSGDELFRLGMMYSTGQGGAPLDLVSAHMMFNLAAMKGSLEASVYRRELSHEMEREDIAEAQRAARRWLDQGSTAIHA